MAEELGSYVSRALVAIGALVITLNVPRTPSSRAPTASTGTVIDQIRLVVTPEILKIIHLAPSDPERENIEHAERVNLYQMQRYGRSFVPPVLEQLGQNE